MTDPPIPVIDLFAGPGGLGEGFSAYAPGGRPASNIRLSIEKGPQAHATLELRSFFRQFPRHRIPEQYYDFLRDVDVPLPVRRKRLFDWFPDEADAVGVLDRLERRFTEPCNRYEMLE